MSVTKRRWNTADGRERVAWRARYRMNGVDFCKQFASKEEAERFNAMTVLELQAGLHTPDSRTVTFDTVAQRYLEYKQPLVSSPTYLTYCREVSILIGYVGNVKLSKFTPQLSHNFLDQLMTKQNVSESHRFKAWTTYKKVMKFACERGYIHLDVCSMIAYPDNKRDLSKRESYVPDTDEVEAFMKFMLGNCNKVMILTLALTGLRIGEAQGLKWVDIDFDEKTLRVQRSINRDGRIGLPKSRAGNRLIPLASGLCTVLKKWRLQSVQSGTGDFVFPGTNGKPLNYVTVIHRWNFTWDRMPLAAIRFTPHALRHHYASRLIENKFSDLQIMTWMGHKDLTTTYKTYGHLLSETIPQAKVDGLSSDLGI